MFPFQPLRVLFFLAPLVFAFSSTAEAHPHAWIDYRVKVVFGKSGQIIALKEHWLFDTYYTEFALHDFDANKNKKLDHGELLLLAKDNIANLKDFDYFTSVQKDGREMAFSKVTGIDSSMEKDRIGLDFTVWLESPLDVKTSKVDYRIYDPTYYTSMLHEKEGTAITLEGDGAKGCSFKLFTPKPDIMKIQFAANLGKNTKAPDQLGAFFAQKVFLSCP